MINIGPGELVMICIIALIVLGPDKLPQTLRTVGRVTGELRRISSGFQHEIQNAFEEETLEDRRRREERRTTAREASAREEATPQERVESQANGSSPRTGTTPGTTPGGDADDERGVDGPTRDRP